MLTNNWEVAEPLHDWLSERGNVVVREGGRFWESGYPAVDLLLSYCYRHIIPQEVIDRYYGCAVNLHNAFLPWGRGVEPLFFGVLAGEPLGVSIHWMTDKVDIGEVIVRRRFHPDMSKTFREVYAEQHELMREVFKAEAWPLIQTRVGSYHGKETFKAARRILGPEGWDCTLETAKRRWMA
jgi:methionyl-tRNA formyltransferase